LENDGMSKRGKSEICPLFRGEENYIHVKLICAEIEGWREMILNYRALNINEGIRLKKIANFTKTRELKKN
jgi:hypothetical protein